MTIKRFFCTVLAVLMALAAEERYFAYADTQRELERALDGGEKLCELDVVGGYVAAFEVLP